MLWNRILRAKKNCGNELTFGGMKGYGISVKGGSRMGCIASVLGWLGLYSMENLDV